MECCACRKKITGIGKLISCDGDFVCNDECYTAFKREMDAVCRMSDSQFEDWLTGRNELYPANAEVTGAPPPRT